MFFRTKKSEPDHETELARVIATALPDADDETRSIVTAVAGLFGCVSYADLEFSGAEHRVVEASLATIHGISERDAQAILAAVQENIVHVSTVEAPRYARTLKQLGDRDLRVHVLDMLLDVAAADHDLAHAEVVFLRQITTSLGLEQSDYNTLQARHREKLSLLKD
jgi:uncharacterized tellurite resistance protein B-like protein